MTHVVHPYAHRLGIIRDWRSRWFAPTKKDLRTNIQIDEEIRRFLKKKLRSAFIAEVEIERTQTELKVFIHTARPGVVIGRNGENATKLRKEIETLVKSIDKAHARKVSVDILEIRQPETNASVVAMMVVEGLEKHMPFRRVGKTVLEKVMAIKEVQGVRLVLSGRLGGADMGRTEQMKKGRVPLQTFRANIDYAHQEARLSYGTIGVKVWIYLGEQFEKDNAAKRNQ